MPVELRVLQYFLTVAREQSISAAAQALHLSQPTLSRQLKEMEEELGKTLFLRGNRKITLTEEGMILRKRAQEVMELLEKAQEEIACSTEIIAGNIHIGAGETEGIHPLIRAAHALQKQYPLVHFHIVSGDKTTVLEELDHGLIDFALIFGEIDTSRYDFLPLPAVDAFGVLMPKDAPLAQKAVIAPQDLLPYPLITSRQMLRDDHLAHIFGNDAKNLTIAGTYNLLFNGSIMVEEGMGYAICFDNIIHISEDSSLCFRPLSVQVSPQMQLIWKKYQTFTKASQKFLETLRASMSL